MKHTYELMPNNPATHPVTGDKKIKQSLGLIGAKKISAADIEYHLGHIERVYNDRPPEVVAPLAQHLLGAVLQLDTVRTEAIQKVLSVIQERGLWVEPAESAGGRAPGIEPAETFEEFVARNQLTAERLAERARKASRVEAAPLAESGELGNGRPRESRGDNYHSYSESGRGTSSDYLLAKLARDCPEFLQRWKAGEFASVRAACLAAGILKAQPQLVLTKDPFTSAQRIQEQRSQHWISDLIGSLSPGGISATQSPGEVRVFLEDLKPDCLRYVLSSLFSRRLQLLDHLLEDLAEDDQHQWEGDAAIPPAPIHQQESQQELPLAEPAPPAKSNGHGTPVAGVIELPAPGFYRPVDIAKALGKRPDSFHSLVCKAADGSELLKRELADTPIRIVVHKDRPPAERCEVITR
jgi:hypothetical protein